MELYNNNYYMNAVLLKGNVHYTDKEPVKEAIVILEQLFKRDYSWGRSNNYESIYSTYTTTNCHGEFCFLLYDRTTYYKIKVFDNQYSYRQYYNSNININLE